MKVNASNLRNDMSIKIHNLMKIEKFKGTNEKAPLDFIKSRIRELIKKKKNVDFIKKFDKEILENAKQENKFEIFN